MIEEIKAELPDAEVLLSLAPQELAGVLFPIFKRNRDEIHLYNLINKIHQMHEVYPRARCEAIGLAFSEAWSWLVTQGLIVPKPRDMGNWFSISRAGEKITTGSEFANYAKASLLPRNLLHPKIAENAWANFLRGAYDLAVFTAFREVEEAVREAAEYDARAIGVDMMRRAFNSKDGPLSDLTLPDAEREALAHLFAGAIGSYKNPSSHRTVTIADTGEAGEMLILASHLLRIVEDRARRCAGDGPPLFNG